MTTVEVTRTYLEMMAPHELRGASPPPAAAAMRLVRVAPCPRALSRALYDLVGRDYHWRDRHAWTDQQLDAYLARPELSVFVLEDERGPAGFFELLREGDGAVEIALFGLRPDRHGQGLGKWLLTRAVEEAWAAGASRVWLHTCTLDSPAALPNYLARGFREVRRELYRTRVDSEDTTAQAT